jgi:hypothetical protein
MSEVRLIYLATQTLLMVPLLKVLMDVLRGVYTMSISSQRLDRPINSNLLVTFQPGGA